MSEYVVNDTDMTSVANAIRTRGGTSNSLSFPNGFISAIQAIPSGGGGGSVTEITVSDSGNVTQSLNAETIYHFTGALTALTISLNTASSGQLAIYHFDFTMPSTAFTPTLNGVTLQSGQIWTASKRYEVSVLNGYGVVGEW